MPSMGSERFDAQARPEPSRYDGGYNTYMVRGPFAAEGEAFLIPPPARH